MFYRILSKIERVCANYQGKGVHKIKGEVSTIAKFISNPKLAIDIGGNIGAYSALLKLKFPDISIHLFEPAQYNYDQLITRFRDDDKVTINKAAVSDSNGVVNLFFNVAGSELASLNKRRLNHLGISLELIEQVASVKFEDYWNTSLLKSNIDIVKLDVEGHELTVLKGMGEAIKHIKVIQFEFGGCNIDSKTYFQDFWYFFKENGFSINRITPFGVMPINFYSEHHEAFVTTNFICVNTGLF
ncbi:FkbM family methyltransferase [Mucilaginibacter sp. FT3.2]|uniref:FkbM family methyltransferase n=1 Tax=Mucilaginibacter sp. FT3.2 TaxID=2723090 RepID=UPI001617A049|nr:FkbM family methyltransferase [Mucilaginibacter sp. FT3.2]MBB6231027.1 FkbM family methyltransferase [Mucilaginibacter sp. FT3.2]